MLPAEHNAHRGVVVRGDAGREWPREEDGREQAAFATCCSREEIRGG